MHTWRETRETHRPRKSRARARRASRARPCPRAPRASSAAAGTAAYPDAFQVGFQKRKACFRDTTLRERERCVSRYAGAARGSIFSKTMMEASAAWASTEAKDACSELWGVDAPRVLLAAGSLHDTTSSRCCAPDLLIEPPELRPGDAPSRCPARAPDDPRPIDSTCVSSGRRLSKASLKIERERERERGGKKKDHFFWKSISRKDTFAQDIYAGEGDRGPGVTFVRRVLRPPDAYARDQQTAVERERD